ncbi:MAG: hypothetical protein AAF650_03895 [Pseudomonadota bacterium]
MIELTTPASIVQAVMAPALILMGASHIVQPALWRGFFVHLHSLGPTGVVYRTFALELWPALLILVLHPVWEGPGIALTIYGWLLAAKVTLSLLAPSIGLKSLSMAEGTSDAKWALAGVVLIALGGCCVWALALG